jgi:hypothetical protein
MSVAADSAATTTGALVLSLEWRGGGGGGGGGGEGEDKTIAQWPTYLRQLYVISE